MLNELMITLLCANSTLIQQKHCNITSKAILKQLEVYEKVDNFEKRAKKEALKATPKLAKNTIAYSAAFYSFFLNREIKFGFKIPDFCDKLEIGMSVSSASARLSWNF